MNALGATHYPISNYSEVKDQDHVFVIFPKGQLNLNAVAAKLTNIPNPHSELLNSNWLSVLKENNKKSILCSRRTIMDVYRIRNTRPI